MTSGPWRYRQRLCEVSLPSAAAFGGRVEFASVTGEQLLELQALGRKIQGNSPQIVGPGAIAGYAAGRRDVVPPAQLALLDSFVAAEATAGRDLPGWLSSSQINRGRTG